MLVDIVYVVYSYNSYLYIILVYLFYWGIPHIANVYIIEGNASLLVNRFEMALLYKL